MAFNDKQQAIALDLATGVTQRRAAKRHGIHYMTITRWKQSSEFTNEIKRLRKSFVEAAKKRACDRAQSIPGSTTSE